MNRSKKKSFDWYGMRQRFSIRKYHIGAASVLLGMTLVLSAGTIVSAETGVNGDGASNEQIVPVNNDGISDGTQPQGDNQGDNSSGVQTGNTTNPTANVQPAGDTGPASGQPVVNPRTMALTPEGDGLTNQPVAEPIMIIPSSATATAPQGYVTVTFAGNQYINGFTLGEQTGSSVQVFVKNGVTWGTLLDDPAWQWPTVKIKYPGDTVVGWAVNISYNGTYNPNNAFARDKYKDEVVTNTKLYPNVVYEVEDVNYATKEEYLALYGSDDRDKWIIITFDAGQGQLNGSKTSKMVAVSNNLYPIEFSNNKFREKVESPTLQGHTFVRWQTDAGEVLPKSGPITTETTYKALYLAHPQNKVAVFDSANLTDSEKEQVKKNILDANPDLSTGVAPAIKAIDISDTGEATVTFDDGTVVKVSSTTLTNEDQDTARSNAKAEIEKEATEKSDAINASNLTEEEKTAKLEEVNNAKAAADSAIDQANTSDELNQALTNGQSAISGIDTSTSAKKDQAKQDLETAYNAKKDEIANSALTAEEKAAKQAELDQAKSAADRAIDAATDYAGVAQALINGKKAIAGIDTSTSAKKAQAKEDLEAAYNAKKDEIANSALTAEEKAVKQAELDQVKSAADSAIDAATDDAGVAQALTDGKSAITGIDTSTSAKKAQAKQDLETAYNAKKAEIESSALTAEEKVAKQEELDQAKSVADSAIDAATDDAGVAQALTDGKTAIAGIDTNTSAKKAQAKQDLETAYNAKKDEIAKSALTAEEKAVKQAELDQAKSTADSAIDAATDDAGVARALTDGKTAIAAIDTTASPKKTAAKKDLEDAYNAKKAEIANSGLTAEEKTAKQAELDQAKSTADSIIDAATDNAGVDTALTNGQSAISGIDTSTSAKKEQAKQDLETAYNAKKDEIANSALTAEEKAAKQAELDQAKSAADRAIDAATDYAGVAQALINGKKAIAGIDTSTSAKKAQAKEDLEAAYNAKKDEIANSALTAEEKAAKQAELDQVKSAADSAIDAATDDAGVAQALTDGKSAIDAINTTTSAEKAAAKKDLEAAYNAKKEEIAKSSLTAEEKAAKQAELDKAKADADKAIDAATDASGVAKALEAGKSAIDAINTTTSAEKAAAKKDLEAAYNAKKAEIENSALTAEEKAAKQAELDKAKADADKAIDAATDASGVAKALEAGKAAIDAIDAATKADEVDTATLAGEKAAAKKDLEAAYNAKKAEIENSALTAEEKAAKQAELDKAKEAADKAIDVATDASGVAKALEAGKAAIDAINTSTSAGIDTSTSAKKAHKENKVLPKTGDNVGLSSVLGIAGLALLGTAIRKKRED